MKDFAKYRAFFGAEVVRLFLYSVLVGIFLFLVESSFVFVFQGFLRAIQLVEPDKLLLPSWYPTSLNAAVMLLMIFGVLRAIGYLLKVYLGGVVCQAFNRFQRERILRYSLENAERLNSHEVINVYTERVTQAGQLVNIGAQLVLACTTGLLFLALGIRLAPLELSIGIALMFLCLLPMRALNLRTQNAGEGIARESESVNRSLLQGLRHYFFLRIYGLIPREIEGGQRSIRSYEDHYKSFYVAHALKHTFPAAAGVVVIGVITYISVRFLNTPSVKLISFFYIFMRLAQTASETSSTFSEFRLQLPGFHRLFSWNEKFSETVAHGNKKSAPSASISREFVDSLRTKGLSFDVENLGFSFESGVPVLAGVNLQVKSGEVLLIKGESGAGKSTLLSLMLGLLSPSSGKVLLNGFPIESIRDCLGPLVAYVGPDPFLISGTVRENLLYGHPASSNVTDADIWLAIEKAQLSKEIRALPKQLLEVLHEHTQLSTGQRQRLAIARAMLRGPRLLILDEASANLDEVTEGNFIEGLRPLLPGLTTLIISHKNSFDRISTTLMELKKQS